MRDVLSRAISRHPGAAVSSKGQSDEGVVVVALTYSRCLDAATTEKYGLLNQRLISRLDSGGTPFLHQRCRLWSRCIAAKMLCADNVSGVIRKSNRAPHGFPNLMGVGGCRGWASLSDKSQAPHSMLSRTGSRTSPRRFYARCKFARRIYPLLPLTLHITHTHTHTHTHTQTEFDGQSGVDAALYSVPLASLPLPCYLDARLISSGPARPHVLACWRWALGVITVGPVFDCSVPRLTDGIRSARWSHRAG
jgi:hypothetical protein